MKTKISINSENRLYIIPCKFGKRRKGYTCLGFEYAFERGKAIALWLIEHGVRVSNPKMENIGTVSGYKEYEALINAARIRYTNSNERCPSELCPELIGLEGRRVEVIDCYGQKRRFYVGKSTGWIPCHLEIARIDSSGGPAVIGAPFQTVTIIQDANRRY